MSVVWDAWADEPAGWLDVVPPDATIGSLGPSDGRFRGVAYRPEKGAITASVSLVQEPGGTARPGEKRRCSMRAIAPPATPPLPEEFLVHLERLRLPYLPAA